MEEYKMKKSLVLLTLIMVVCLGLGSFVACSPAIDVANSEKVAQDTMNNESEGGIIDQPESTRTLEPQKLSENIVGVYAESERNVQLEKTIIDYFQIPVEYLGQTKYYYNYVDLNGDGYDEIFTVVIGPYTSGTGGDTALHIIISPTGEMNVNQKFTLIQIPVIISDKVTNGCKEIIAMKSGGGAESKYVVLTASDGQYTSVNEGIVINGLEGVSGKAIISNDILKDMEEGKPLYLQKHE